MVPPWAWGYGRNAGLGLHMGATAGIHCSRGASQRALFWELKRACELNKSFPLHVWSGLQPECTSGGHSDRFLPDSLRSQWPLLCPVALGGYAISPRILPYGLGSCQALDKPWLKLPQAPPDRPGWARRVPILPFWVPPATSRID